MNHLDSIVVFHGLLRKGKVTQKSLEEAARASNVEPAALRDRITELRNAALRINAARKVFEAAVSGDLGLLRPLVDLDLQLADARRGTSEADILLLAREAE